MEHTNSPAVAREIARDHLAESPDYYKWLEEMEARMKAKKIDKAQIIRMPAASSSDAFQPEPERGVSYPTQVLAQQWLERLSGRKK